MSRNCSTEMAMSQYVYDYYQTVTSRKLLAIKTWWNQVIIIVDLGIFKIIIILIKLIINYRFFILWYQILGHNAPDSLHAMFATLVPGFASPIPEHPGLAALGINHSNSAIMHDHFSSNIKNNIQLIALHYLILIKFYIKI